MFGQLKLRIGDYMEQINIDVMIEAPLAEVWKAYTTPADIVQWNAASDDWHTTRAEVDLRVGGTFVSRMEARDGSAGFDFAGTYTDIVPNERIAYDFGERSAIVTFTRNESKTRVTVTFDAEESHPLDMQRAGWQAILDRFAAHMSPSNA